MAILVELDLFYPCLNSQDELQTMINASETDKELESTTDLEPLK
jgi:hypothetical protein